MTNPEDQQLNNNNGTANASSNTSTTNEIARVSVRIPPFWKSNPALWFKQLESQFVVASITNDATRYHTVVGSIEANILSEVQDLILQPPTSNMYESLKKRLLQRFTDSEEKRLKKLLSDFEIGDRKPSTLLLDMRSLASNVTDDVLKSLWLQRLPQQMQAILAVSGETLDKLATMADKIADATEQMEVRCVTKEPKTVELEQQIAALAKKIEKFTHQRSNSRNRSRPSNNTSINRSKKPLCWYHYKFGNQAKKCQPPCNFQNSKSEN